MGFTSNMFQPAHSTPRTLHWHANPGGGSHSALPGEGQGGWGGVKPQDGGKTQDVQETTGQWMLSRNVLRKGLNIT